MKTSGARTSGALLLALVVVFYVLTRAWLLWSFRPQASELGVLYFSYAVSGADFDRTPYADFQVEYPPLSYLLLTVPRRIDPQPIAREWVTEEQQEFFRRRYVALYRLMMAGGDLVAVLLLGAIVRRIGARRLPLVLGGYTLVTVLLGHVLYDRLDMPLLVLLLAWAYCWQRAYTGERQNEVWQIVAAAALGLGISYKLIPVVMAPLVLLSDVQAIRRGGRWRSVVAAWIVLAVVALGPYLAYYRLVGDALFTMFEFHQVRGIEIESLWATAMMAMAPLGWQIHAFRGVGSIDLGGDLEAAMLAAAGWALSGLLTVSAAWALWRGQAFDRATAGRTALWVVAASVILSKVLSAQYMVWALPVMLLLAADVLKRRGFVAVIAAAIVIAALTTFVFPYNFFSRYPPESGVVANPWGLMPDLGWPACAALMARNLLYLGCVVALAVGVMRKRNEALPSGE